MRILYIDYALWKNIVETRGFAPFHKDVDTDTKKAWAGLEEIVFATDVVPADHSDWAAAFPGSNKVDTEDVAIANIVGLGKEIYVKTNQRKLALRTRQFSSVTDNSDNLNIDGSPAQSLLIWDGETGAWTRGGVGSELGGPNAHSGSTGINTGVTALDDEVTFSTSAFDPSSGNDALTFWIDPMAFPPGSDPVVFFRLAASQVGVKLKVQDYVRSLAPNRPYMRVCIVLPDFQLGGNVDELVIKMEGAAGQRYRIDDVALSTGPTLFRINGPSNEARHVKNVRLVLSANNAGWGPNVFANQSLLDGGFLVQHRRLSTGKVFWKLNSQDNVDLFGQFSVISNDVFPGSPDKRIITMEYVIPPSLTIINVDDVIDILVRDDLSGLLAFEAFSSFEKEDV